MMKLTTRLIALSFLSLAAAAPARAGGGLIGTQVTGTLEFAGNPKNLFDPANGGVPQFGYLNSPSEENSPTVLIAEPAIEYGYKDGVNTFRANFSDTQLTFDYNATSTGTIGPITATFTDSAFTSISEVSDSFPTGISGKLAGDVITLTWGGIAVVPGKSFAAVFDVGSAVPEPSSLVLAGCGILVGLGFALWHRRRRAGARLAWAG
jgi:hypothetical protein